LAIANQLTDENILAALGGVKDPEIGRDLVSLGMVKKIDIDGSVVDLTVELTTPACPLKATIENDIVESLQVLGATAVRVDWASNVKRTFGGPAADLIPGVKNTIAVASGKGGVGKSTMTANLAAALQAEGQATGALDCDVYGYSIPRMLGVNRKPEVNAQRKIVPVSGPAGIKVMSIGFFLEDNAAVVWRGPMLHKAIQQFLEDVDWGELDYLLLDLPPGTGDVSMTLAQLLPQAKVLIVTTPQPAAQSVARRAAEMAGKVDLELLGVIENMSGFTAPDGQRFAIFGEGGGQLLADELGVPLIGKVPLSEELREHADAGAPLVLEKPDAPAGQAVRDAARGIVAATPHELPVMQAPPASVTAQAPVSGTELPVVQ
jgi:ATP-binding protein involved in chromosome partitioning